MNIQIGIGLSEWCRRHDEQAPPPLPATKPPCGWHVPGATPQATAFGRLLPCPTPAGPWLPSPPSAGFNTTHTATITLSTTPSIHPLHSTITTLTPPPPPPPPLTLVTTLANHLDECQPHATFGRFDPDGSLPRGWLSKEGHLFKNWKNRYFAFLKGEVTVGL